MNLRAHQLSILSILMAAGLAIGCQSIDEALGSSPESANHTLGIAIVGTDGSDDSSGLDGGPLHFVDDAGIEYTVDHARVVIRDIELDLPRGMRCADIADQLAGGAVCKSPASRSDDDGTPDQGSGDLKWGRGRDRGDGSSGSNDDPSLLASGDGDTPDKGSTDSRDAATSDDGSKDPDADPTVTRGSGDATGTAGSDDDGSDSPDDDGSDSPDDDGSDSPDDDGTSDQGSGDAPGTPGSDDDDGSDSSDDDGTPDQGSGDAPGTPGSDDDDGSDSSDDDGPDGSNDDDGTPDQGSGDAPGTAGSDDPAGSSSDDDRTILIRGPFVVDLLTGEASPSLADVRVPALAYSRIDARIDEGDVRDGVLGTADELVDRSLVVHADFAYMDTPLELRLSLSFSEDVRFEAPGGVPAGPALQLELDLSRWLAGISIGECLDDGDIVVENGLLVVDDDSDLGGCSDIENDIKDNVKESGRTR